MKFKPVKEDKKDEDIDVKVKIAPNTLEEDVTINIGKNKNNVTASALDTKKIAPVEKVEVDEKENENRGDKIVGFKGKTPANKTVITVGKQNSDSDYIKERKHTKDFADEFAKLSEIGSPDLRRAHIMKADRAAKANQFKDPIRTLIKETVNSYSGNLVSDIHAIFNERHAEIDDFIAIYKNSPAAFQAKLANLKTLAGQGEGKVKKKHIREAFEGYHAHHYISANFLWNNETIQELLMQPGIEFKFNNIENLIFLPPENHLKPKYRGHNEYDKYISRKITKEVDPLVAAGEYDDALDALKDIVSETKDLFVSKYIGTEDNIDKPQL